MTTETNKTEAGELRNWPIFFTEKERERLLRYAESIRSSASRPPRESELGNVLAQTVLELLGAAEALAADIDEPMRAEINKVKNLRPAPEEGKGG